MYKMRNSSPVAATASQANLLVKQTTHVDACFIIGYPKDILEQGTNETKRHILFKHGNQDA